MSIGDATARAGDQSAAEDLREVLSKPLFNPVLKTFVGDGSLDYEVYLRTKDLLSLQTPAELLTDPDELMFQIVHQAQEVWLKLISHELTEVVGDLDRDELWEVAARLERVIRISGCLAEEIRVLETLTPDTYQVIRRSLGNGSGQESPGFNATQIAAQYVADAFDRLLRRRNLQAQDVYAAGRSPALKRISELLVDFDERYQLWLVAHYMLVRRTIGVGRDITALDGVSTRILVGRMTKPLFHSLWRVRDAMTVEWNRDGGHQPGADRSAMRDA
jgi:tryptophan 2,3-dioxygenase